MQNSALVSVTLISLWIIFSLAVIISVVVILGFTVNKVFKPELWNLEPSEAEFWISGKFCGPDSQWKKKL